jgi:CHAT domain-containing protein
MAGRSAVVPVLPVTGCAVRRWFPLGIVVALLGGAQPSLAAKARGAGPATAVVQSVLSEAEAFRVVGNLDQEQEVLTRALDTLGGDGPDAYQLYEHLRRNYGDRGNFFRAIAVGERQLSTVSSPAQEHHVLVSLAVFYAALHDKAKAAAALERIERLMPRLRASNGWQRSGFLWQADLARAKAAIERQAGHPAQAEDGWKACLSAAQADRRENPDRAVGVLDIECMRGLIEAQIATGQLAAAGGLADQLRTTADRVVELKSRPAVSIRVDTVLGRLAVEQGRLDDARRIYVAALDALQGAKAGDGSLRSANLRLQLALLEMLAGNWDKALGWHRQREASLREAGSERGKVAATSVEYAYTLVRLGRPHEALGMMERIVGGRRELYDDSSLYLWESLAFRGIALAAAGRYDEALRELRVAIPRVVEIARAERTSAEAGALRTARLNWLLDGYLSLLARYAMASGTPETIDEAFRMADLARGSTVQRALAASASRAAISDPLLADLARREQDLQREVGALAESIANLLARDRVAEQDKVVAELRARLAALRREQAAALAEIERRFPDYAALLTPKPVSIAALQKLLKPTEALVSVFSCGDRTLVWAIPPSGPARFAVSSLTLAQLDQKVTILRKALDPGDAIDDWPPNFDFEVAYELYAQLLQPVGPGWKGAQELIVVPHGRLGQLPFGLLTTGPWKAPAAKLRFAEMADAPWLIKQVAVSQLPAAIALPALRAQSGNTRAGRPFIGFGDPIFTARAAAAGKATRGIVRRQLPMVEAGPARMTTQPELGQRMDFALLPPLPDTAVEIREVAAALVADDEHDVYLGQRASEAMVKKASLADYRVIMFATHGLMNGEMPGLYQPALALSNPELTGDGEDGMLTMEEILGLKLRADWVVLSACNSAAAGRQSGEAVSGLGRAFFYAGAKSLLVTNWAVETESARMLTTEAFRRQAAEPGLSRAGALRQAALVLMRKSAGNSYSYAHPMFWAPYSLVGDGH